MLRQHSIFPTVVDTLPIITADDVELAFTFENVNTEGFIIRINAMYPFNTENKSHKLAFRDRVTDLTDDSLFVDITKNLSTNAGPNTFNPYCINIPRYDINVTRALYPELFPLNQHEHSIFLRLLDSDNNLLYQSLESVSPAYPVYDRLLPDIYTDFTTKKLRGQFGNVLDDLEIMRDKIYQATPFEYDLVDGDTVLVTKRGIHSQTTSGILPQPLQGYDGDLSIVYHGFHQLMMVVKV